MSLHRFCCPESVPEGDRVRIAGAAAAQIRKVLRLSPGDRVVLFGADEWEYTVRLESVERDAALGAVIARSAPQAEPRCELTLVIALLKGEKTEWVLQKGTELGVGRFVLMQTRRTIAAPDERRAAGRQERYGRIVREATEQCGRVRPPCIEGVRSFSQVVAESSSPKGFILHERATLRFSDQLAQGGVQAFGRSGVQEADHDVSRARLTLFVGPEGGFTEEEVAMAAAHGVAATALGSRVLRAETAALAAVTLAMDALDR
jgi:16S rRNA (uracil1498-N3)-methyltransferase